MNGIVPLNVAALRVSSADASNATGTFAGATVAFDQLQWGPTANEASTGDTIWRPLQNDDPPADRLDAGIHLHWELPDHYSRGVHDPDTGAIRFPAAPPRWLVVRELAIDDQGTGDYGPITTMSWIVESDYLADAPQVDADGITRPTVSVPLTNAQTGAPYRYLGRVVPAASWDPASESPSDFLPANPGPDGHAHPLTSIGFVGAAFSSYYPDCRSVFGFWDTFADVPAVRAAITQALPIRFRCSYRVIGWHASAADDPLAALAAAETVRDEFDAYVAHCHAEQVPPTETPASVFQRIAQERFGWNFDAGAVGYTLAGDGTIQTLTTPDATLCAGTVQDVVWLATDPSTQTPFLTTPEGGTVWTGEVQAAIGNTTVEAVSALVAGQVTAPEGTGLLADEEALLEALQLGLLHDLQSDGNALVELEAALHDRSFRQLDGGHTWTVQAAATAGPSTASAELTLPLALAEQLAALNAIQAEYDQARQALVTMRQQLFMDWLVYVKELVAGTGPIDVDTFMSFLATSSGGELNAVIAAGNAAGLLHFTTDDDQRITAVTTASGSASLAARVVQAWNAVAAELRSTKAAWRLDAVPATPFAMPTDPVLVMEGDALEPARRNGAGRQIAVRHDAEVVDRLHLVAGSADWTVTASQLAGVPAAPGAVPQARTVNALLAEQALLDPARATQIAAASGAPAAVLPPAAIVATQGGWSPIDLPAPTSGGLYAAVHDADAKLAANPSVTVTAPVALTTTFTNATATAQAPDAVGWSAQTRLPELAATREDPFLPIWLTWTVGLDPLAAPPAGYPATTITDGFTPDLGYAVPPTFTTGDVVPYTGAVALSRRPMLSLVNQIDQYLEQYPGDTDADADLRAARDALAGRRLMSQALGGFGLAQTLRLAIPQLPVENLTPGSDPITDAIAAAATAVDADDWYDTGLSALAPLAAGLQADYNFGPLRAGFLEVASLGIIDAFGQRMRPVTQGHTASGALQVRPSRDLTPEPGDTANAERAYLPPRLLAPTRLEAAFLSAAHDGATPDDFIETNAHPATSPVCGWIVPNHLESSLAFYDASGAAIGSFGLEHGAAVYRTRAGNLANRTGTDLAADIGTEGAPAAGINPHLATLMWFVHDQAIGTGGTGGDPGVLADLMTTILASDHMIAPSAAAQDAALAVFMGRPLAVVRHIVSVQTAGGTLPVSQSAATLAQVVTNGWTGYADRQAATSAGLGEVTLPLRFGDAGDLNDGLVAFLPEASGASPYAEILSAYAPVDGAHRVTRPGPDAITRTLNGPALTFTALVDPRAPVHIATPLLPTATLQVPADQYVRAMQQLALTFTTRPVLSDQRGLRLPLPAEPAYEWAWVAPGQAPVVMAPAAAADTPTYGQGPQRLLEGWLQLSPAPPPPSPPRAAGRPARQED